MAQLGTQEGRPMVITETIGADADEDLSLTTVYHLLQNERRRQIIRYLMEADGVVTRDEIVGQIAAWENDADKEHISSQARRRVYVALHQIHLPKLDSADVLEYGSDRGTVTPRSALEGVHKVLENTTRVRAVEGTSEAKPMGLGVRSPAAVGLVVGIALGLLIGSLRSGFTTGRILFATLAALLFLGGIAAFSSLLDDDSIALDDGT